ncbi:mechanosensitive ion channel [Natronosporangium hydrolyticum]|uniref:Mechanosensitive ion channel n=1 Tax=Natronosporangium hydrolyticum TaxID=2811111 RepID=A0A895YQ96_9ACTN|nr:mechanosensitive ion channel domain-containing protein [Natronosporangium hydrolyticum]QSB16906.1 mechanosensitive ion channel [Natronosporangium hydrolyticum]
MAELWQSLGPLLVVACAATVGLFAVEVGHRMLLRAGQRVWFLASMTRRAYRPTQLLVSLLLVRIAVVATTDTGLWRDPLLHALLIAVIIAAGWLLGVMLLVLEDGARSRLRTDGPDNRTARQVQTQVMILRRVTVVLVTVLTVGTALTTFPGVRTFGATMLASAGLAGVVAGFAAQQTLGNLFAGLQLAFGGALRLDDVVVVEGEWGHVEELTLCYAVVRIWDQRRLVLPTSYFTTTPFTIWTRRGAEILGTVMFELDWAVPVRELRAELERVARQDPRWDGRVATLQVVEATGGLVTVRGLVSAANADASWDLRCAVREHLVEWLQIHHPYALPRTRTEVSGGGGDQEPVGYLTPNGSNGA